MLNSNRRSSRISGEIIASRGYHNLMDSAEDRGHGPRSKGAALGGLFGGLLGSFAGIVGAGAGAAVGATIGAAIGETFGD